jgi:hypothetical protein
MEAVYFPEVGLLAVVHGTSQVLMEIVSCSSLVLLVAASCRTPVLMEVVSYPWTGPDGSNNRIIEWHSSGLK